jgi:hypothetical protein
VGLREKLREKPAIGYGMTAILLLVAGVVIWQSLQPTPPARKPKLLFTVDDGQTTFEADFDRIPPFDHEGRQAVRAYVFKPASGGEPFVAYLEKYSDEAKQRLESAEDPTEVMEDLPLSAYLVKTPGKGTWVPSGGGEANAIRAASNRDDIVPVVPALPG